MDEDYAFEFILVEDKNETPEKNKNKTPVKKKKSGDWKTVKIQKGFKALKRYRTVERIEKLKALKN